MKFGFVIPWADADEVGAMAASSVRQKRAILNAPRVASEEDIAALYAGALSYW